MEDKLIPGYKTASSMTYGMLKFYAAENRCHQTLAEKKLWNELKNNRYNIKFRRQHIIESFIVDFACLNAKLVIEVDGGYHAELQQAMDDENRTKDLNEIGFEVIRFTNEEILSNCKLVAERIYQKVFELNPNA